MLIAEINRMRKEERAHTEISFSNLVNTIENLRKLMSIDVIEEDTEREELYL